MLASIKHSVLTTINRCGYAVLKSDKFRQLLGEAEETRHQLEQHRHQLENVNRQLQQSRDEFEKMGSEAASLRVELETSRTEGRDYHDRLVIALDEIRQLVAASEDSRNKLEQSRNELGKIRSEAASLSNELQKSRTECRDHFDRLVIALDEIRRLKIRIDDLPQINYQHLMRQQHEEAQFRDADPAFMSLYEQVCPFTMTSIERLYAMYKATEYVSKSGIPGSIVECGVWRGGSMMMAALTLLACADRSRKLVLFDTFAGLPKPNPTEDVDLWGHSQYNEWTRHSRSDTSSDMAFASLEEVRANMASTGYPMENVIFVKGMVQDTLAKHRPDSVGLLRLDTDWYESTVCELEKLYPLLSKNGVLIIDDYGHLRGQRKAVDEFFARRNEHLLLNRVDYSGRVAIKS